MTGDEILGKFRGCLEFGLGTSPSQADRLAAVVCDLETTPDAAAALIAAFPEASRHEA